MEEKNVKEAEEQFKLALYLDLNDADIHCSYGDLLAVMECWEEADEQCGIVLKVNPNDENAHRLICENNTDSFN